MTPQELERYTAIPPSGVGLPLDGGNAAQGRLIYDRTCAACHGEKLEGIKATGVPAPVGGRGSLTSPKPIKTVESYWPFATTDYVRRAMPFNAPGSLTDDEVYAVTAYTPASGYVIAPSQTLDAVTLTKVAMPNRQRFIPDPRPQAESLAKSRN